MILKTYKREEIFIIAQVPQSRTLFVSIHYNKCTLQICSKVNKRVNFNSMSHFVFPPSILFIQCKLFQVDKDDYYVVSIDFIVSWFFDFGFSGR